MNHSYNNIILSFFIALVIAAADVLERKIPETNQYCTYNPKCYIFGYPGMCCYKYNGSDCPVTSTKPGCTIFTEADKEDSDIIVMEQILVVGGGAAGAQTVKGLRG